MIRGIKERSAITQALCLLCVVLVFAMGTAQAVHSHPADLQTSHHSCSICAAPSLGPAVATINVLPMVKTIAMAHAPTEIFIAFRPVITNFVRPPPAV